jgi:hypothetical protein
MLYDTVLQVANGYTVIQYSILAGEHLLAYRSPVNAELGYITLKVPPLASNSLFRSLRDLLNTVQYPLLESHYTSKLHLMGTHTQHVGLSRGT